MTSATLHLEVLPSPARKVLSSLGPKAAGRGFYLAGGTALALQLGHRRSIDFDWFRSEPIPDPVALAADLGVEVRSTAEDTLHAEADGIRVSFFRYRYPLLQPLRRFPELPAPLASTLDLAAMKLAAITQRGSRRDYHDLAAIGRSGTGLPEMLEAYRSKFSVRDAGHVLAALTWFDDAERDPEPVLEARSSWEGVKADLREWVKRLASP